MTNTELVRGQEIQNEISGLKAALIMLNADNFFKITSGSCSRYDADPFLSTLHLQLKELGVREICKKIDILEKEFSAL